MLASFDPDKQQKGNHGNDRGSVDRCSVGKPCPLELPQSEGPGLWRVWLDVCSTEKNIFMPKTPNEDP